MNCQKCNISVMIKPLVRVNPVGESGIFWCNDCVEKHEPELAKNIKEDNNQFQNDIPKIFYNNNKTINQSSIEAAQQLAKFIDNLKK